MIISGPHNILDYFVINTSGIFNDFNIISISKILLYIIRIKFMYDIFKRWNLPLIRWPLYSLFFFNYLSEFIIVFALGDEKVCHYSERK